MKKLKSKLTYANVMATIAVFLVLGGGAAIAGGLGKNTVGSKQLKKESIGTLKLKNGAVTGDKVKAGSLPGSVLAPGAVKPGLGSTVVVIQSMNGGQPIPAKSFSSAQAQCPAGMQAIAGGVDINGVKSGKVSSSAPTFNGNRVISTPDGQVGPANGWEGAVSTDAAADPVGIAKTVVICAPLN